MHQDKQMTPTQERRLAKKIVDTITSHAKKHGRVTCRTQKIAQGMLILTGTTVLVPDVLKQLIVLAGRSGK